MTNVRLAIAGIGNNVSALIQGVMFYGTNRGLHLPGVSRPILGGLSVTAIDFVAAFDVQGDKIGSPLSTAITKPPNNYPDLGMPAPMTDPVVARGIEDSSDASAVDRLAAQLRDSGAEVLLYSLPTGMPAIALAYARAALQAGVAFVNCTADPVARVKEHMELAEAAGVPVIGDDLQSHFGSSVVHGAVLALFDSRGVEVTGSYQLNCGGNADFRNLRCHGEGKEQSKHNALRQKVRDTSRVTVVPSAGFISHLGDRKVGHMAFEGVGWANMPVRLEVRLEVHDSSNASGVIVDLVRIAAVAQRQRAGGFALAAAPLLKSPPILGDPVQQDGVAQRMLRELGGNPELAGRLSISALAAAMAVPADALRSLGLSNCHVGVRVAYRLPDGGEARARVRRELGGPAACVWEVNDLPIVAYGTPRNREWLEERSDLMLFEGESSCWTAWHAGFAATGIPGADLVDVLDYDALYGAGSIVIMLEPDLPATYPRGRAWYERQVLSRLAAIAYPGKVARLDLEGVAENVNTLYRADPSQFAGRLETLLTAAQPVPREDWVP